jgi:hypothetical protein
MKKLESMHLDADGVLLTFVREVCAIGAKKPRQSTAPESQTPSGSCLNLSQPSARVKMSGLPFSVDQRR